MGNALRFVYLLSLVAWVGAVIFFSLVGAPATFQAVPVEVAGRVVTKIFPRYYLLGHVAGGVALVSAIGLAALAGEWSFRRLALPPLLALMLAVGLYADLGVRVRMERVRAAMAAPQEARQTEQALKTRFDDLHRLSVGLNAAILVLGLLVVFLTAVSLRL